LVHAISSGKTFFKNRSNFVVIIFLDDLNNVSALDTNTYLDYPEGPTVLIGRKKIGRWYSNAHWAAVKMIDDQGNILIAPDTPWM
jgi:hypothetical protein